MSATAFFERSLAKIEIFSELEVLRDISRIAAATTDPKAALRDITHVLLRVPGICGIEVDGLTTISPRDSTHRHGLAVAGMKGDRKLKLHFDLRQHALDRPWRLARFVANHMDAVLTRWELEERRTALKQEIERIGEIVARRKAIHRARAILCKSNQISERAALMLLREYSRNQKRSLHAIADAIIISGSTAWTKPALPKLVR
jgi:uncharacterized small protein (DUF1192 family)